MIRRDDGGDWLLISQVDHAHLAGTVAAAWGNERVPMLPAADLLVPAVRDHDEGWAEWERTPSVDPATGVPRDFTEMPMAVSTKLWSHSIDVCRHGRRSMLASLDEFRRYLGGRGMRLTHERAIVAEEVFSSRQPFDAEGLFQRLPERDDGFRVSRATVGRTLSLIEGAGLIEKVAIGSERDAFRQTRRLEQGSAWGGLWVSRHFGWLAEQALRHRADQPAEAGAVRRFLSEQAALQVRCRKDGVKELSIRGRPALEEIGLALVQFFDRLSLWLCCAGRTETATWELPEFGPVHFTPLADRQIAIEPFPLAQGELELTVTARRIPARPLPDDHALREAIAAGTPERLSWRLVHW
jgi:hypothetical protein